MLTRVSELERGRDELVAKLAAAKKEVRNGFIVSTTLYQLNMHVGSILSRDCQGGAGVLDSTFHRFYMDFADSVEFN